MPSTIRDGVWTFADFIFSFLCLPVVSLASSRRPKLARGNAHKELRKRKPPHPPTPIGTVHRPAKQPETFPLLKLPVELRLSIYEHVLGERLVRLELDRSYSETRVVVGATYHMPTDDLGRHPNRATLFTERIFPALLLSCRQVYSEALPILHQRSTFHFWASDLEIILRSQYCLSDIRSVFLLYDLNLESYRRQVIPLLQHLPHLERLAIEFKFNMPRQSGSDPSGAALQSAWGRDILGLRNLRRLELWWLIPMWGIHPDDDTVYNVQLVQKFRELMIGPGADERYRTFLEEYGKRNQDSEVRG